MTKISFSRQGALALLAQFALSTCCHLAAAQAPQPPPATPAPTGNIHGVVMDRDGSVCEGAAVQLQSAGAPARSAISDSSGQFSFSAVAPGRYTLTAKAGGFATQTVTGTLAAGQIVALQTIVLTPANVTDVRVSAAPAEIATMELHEEEKQRVLRVIPNFAVIYAHDAPPLSSRQKFQLAWRSSVDPFAFVAAGAAAGIQQADGTLSAYGGGTAGYARRFGIAYGDYFIETMIGGAVFPSVFKQDPRYFYKGTGSWRQRALYAIANSVVCKGDNGHWQFDYSQFAGDLASGGISDLYYPAANHNNGAIIVENTFISKGGDAIANLFQEFVARHFTKNAPSYGTNP